MIVAESLSKRFGDTTALHALSLTVSPGEILAFAGPNGGGKTTTFKLLRGVLVRSSGYATMGGLDCHKDSVAVKRLVGYVPDEPHFFPYLTGFEVLRFVAGLHGLDRAQAEATLATLMGTVLDEPFLKRPTYGYSLGQRKRLALAAALLHDPPVLILDEPTAGLDPTATKALHALAMTYANRGKTLFLSTHLLDAAARLCHRVAILHEGHLMALDSPASLRVKHGVSQTAPFEDVFMRAIALHER